MAALDSLGRLLARAAREGYVPRTDLTTEAFHGTGHTFPAFQTPPLKRGELDRSLGTHAAKDPHVANYFANRHMSFDPHDPTGPLTYVHPNPNLPHMPDFEPQVYPLWIPGEEKMLTATQPIRPPRFRGEPEELRVANDTRTIAKMMGAEAFGKDRDLLERWLMSAGGLPIEKARGAASEMFRGGKAEFSAGGEGGRADIPSALDYRDVNKYAGTNPSERQLITDLARQSWQDQGYKGIKYRNTSQLEVGDPRVTDPTSYIVFNPADMRARPAARMDAAKAHLPDLLSGVAGGGVLAGATMAAPQPAEATPQIRLPQVRSTLADALSSLAASSSKKQMSNMITASPMPDLPAPPPQSPRPQPPSAMAPMPANPAMTPEWLRQHYLPHLSDPATYQSLPPFSMVPNKEWKLTDPNTDPRMQGVAADVTNLLSTAVGPWW